MWILGMLTNGLTCRPIVYPDIFKILIIQEATIVTVVVMESNCGYRERRKT